MFNKILVAIDLDDVTQNDNLLRAASKIADCSNADVFLLNVVAAPPPDLSQFLPEKYEKNALEDISGRLSDVVKNSDLQKRVKNASARFGNAYQEILTHARNMDVDLIIVASHRPHVSDFLLGTTAARIVRHATCSTLVVRQPAVSVDD